MKESRLKIASKYEFSVGTFYYEKSRQGWMATSEMVRLRAHKTDIRTEYRCIAHRSGNRVSKNGNPLMIELRQLRYLIAASEAGSFSRAAQQLNIKQATLSRQIAYIEKHLGLQLFERVSRGAILTREGEHYLDVARRIVDDFAEINAWVRASRSGAAGRLAIGFYTSLSAGNLRATLAEFSARHPDIEIKRFERDRRLLLAGLHSGAIDVAIMIGEAGHDECQRRSLWSERLLVALAGDHPLLGAEHVRWPDLADERFLLSNGDPGPDRDPTPSPSQ